MKNTVSFALRSGTLVLATGTALWSCATDAEPYDLPETAAPEGVLLRSVRLEPGAAVPFVPADLRAPALDRLDDRAAGRFLVHFRGEAGAVRAKLEPLGIRIETWLPVDTFLVTMTGAAGRALDADRDALGIDLVEPYHPAWRMAPEVSAFRAGDGEARLLVHLFQDGDLEQVRSLLARHGIASEAAGGRHFPRLGVQMSGLELTRLRDAMARLPDVYWIELRGELRLLNDQAVPILESGENGGARVLSDNGLHGEGQVIGYIDTGADYDSCFFRDPSGKTPPVNQGLATSVDPTMRKIIAYDMLWSKDSPTNMSAYDNHGHGTHVGGNAGGDNLAHPIDYDTMDGMATAAQFVVQDGGYAVDNCADLPALGCPVVDLVPFFQQAYDQGARVHTNSWGDNENSSSQNTYSAGSEDADAFAWTHPDFLLLFAAGNSGPGAGTVGSPSTAKNVIAVGGSLNGAGLETVVSFSSRGPTTDDRLKPDLMAPASNTSAGSDFKVDTNNCGLNTGSGTSYASPLVAGAAALVRQYFEDGYYPAGIANPASSMSPSSALVKATLINSAVSMKNTQAIPSMDQGWGRVALDEALPFPGDAEKLRVADGAKVFMSSTDAAYTLPVQVASGQNLKVTLVWTDPPSTPAAAVNLVNDLDLVVAGPNNRTWLGNVFRRGVSVTGGTADSRNNIEQVLVSAASAGTYTVTVKPKRIAQGAQTFALVVRGALR